MRAIPSAMTGPERALFRLLRAFGLRHRRHARDLPGTPDAVVPSAKLALFVDGDFWHGRRWFRDGIAPASNRAFWVGKFEGNRRRDRRADRALRRLGWRPLRIWETDLAGRPEQAARRILRAARPRPDDAPRTRRPASRRARPSAAPRATACR